MDGWFQKRPGGRWYKRGNHNAYEIKTCEGCGREAFIRPAERFCSVSCSKVKKTVTYCQAHLRVSAARGTANGYPCTDCCRPAAEWSYDGLDPNALIDAERGLSYSVKTEFYSPRCKPCHSTYDGGERGERNGNSKLSDTQRNEIAASRETGAVLATRYGISKSQANHVKRSWYQEIVELYP